MSELTLVLDRWDQGSRGSSGRGVGPNHVATQNKEPGIICDSELFEGDPNGI